MLIRHLKFFVTLAEERHFGHAANVCCVTQPTLSQAIRKLEEDLNIALIIRGHRFVSLTPQGEKVLHWARQILSDYESLKEDLDNKHKEGLKGTLRLGVIPAAIPSVPFLSQQFVKQNPLAHIEVRAMSSRLIEKSLEHFEIDGGITYLDNEPLEHVRSFPLYYERYAFACRKDHPLAEHKTVSWAKAVKEPLCLLSSEMQNRRIISGIAAASRLELAPQIVSNSFLGIASYIRLGPWCSIVPRSFGLVFGSMGDIALIGMVKPMIQQTVGLVLTDRLPQSPMAIALQNCAKNANIEQKFEADYP